MYNDYYFFKIAHDVRIKELDRVRKQRGYPVPPPRKRWWRQRVRSHDSPKRWLPRPLL